MTTPRKAPSRLVKKRGRKKERGCKKSNDSEVDVVNHADGNEHTDSGDGGKECEGPCLPCTPQPGAFPIAGIGRSTPATPPSNDLTDFGEDGDANAPQRNNERFSQVHDASCIVEVKGYRRSVEDGTAGGNVAKATPITTRMEMYRRTLFVFNRRCCIASVVAFCLVVICLSSILVWTSRSSENFENNEVDTLVGVGMPWDLLETNTRFRAIYNVALHFTESAAKLQNEKTPEGRALLWLAYSDEYTLNLPLPTDEDELIQLFGQRYTMALVMYSLGLTTFEFKDVSECHWDGSERVVWNEAPSLLGPDAISEDDIPPMGEAQPVGDTFEEEENDADEQTGWVDLSTDGRPEIFIRCNSRGQVIELILENLPCSRASSFASYVINLPHVSTLDITMTFCDHNSNPTILDILSTATSSPLMILRLHQNTTTVSASPSTENTFLLQRDGDGDRHEFLATIPSTLGRMSQLKHLELTTSSGQSSFLGGTLPTQLGLLRHLTHLQISHHDGLGGTLPSELSQLTMLHFLELQQNDFTGKLPMNWGAFLTDLEVLSLSSNRLSGTVPTTWGSLSRLAFLDLSKNDLSGTIPPQLEEESFLGFVDFSYNARLVGGQQQEWTFSSGSTIVGHVFCILFMPVVMDIVWEWA